MKTIASTISISVPVLKSHVELIIRRSATGRVCIHHPRAGTPDGRKGLASMLRHAGVPSRDVAALGWTTKASSAVTVEVNSYAHDDPRNEGRRIAAMDEAIARSQDSVAKEEGALVDDEGAPAEWPEDA